MQWFKHDSDASTDAKIKKLIMRYGTDGYAIYFHCIELIVGNIGESNITFELEHDAEIIADNLKIQGTTAMAPVDRVNSIMRYIVELGLFEETNGHIYCYKLLKRLDSSMTSSAKMRALITDAKQNHDTVMISSCCSHDTVMQEENRIDKEQNKTRTRKQKDFTPPTIEEVTDYVLEKQLVINPYKFIDWYSKTDWKDNKGKQIKNWKMKAINWDSREKENNPSALPYSKPLPPKINVPRRCRHIDTSGNQCEGEIFNSYCKVCGAMYDGDGNEIL